MTGVVETKCNDFKRKYQQMTEFEWEQIGDTFAIT